MYIPPTILEPFDSSNVAPPALSSRILQSVFDRCTRYGAKAVRYILTHPIRSTLAIALSRWVVRRISRWLRAPEARDSDPFPFDRETYCDDSNANVDYLKSRNAQLASENAQFRVAYTSHTQLITEYERTIAVLRAQVDNLQQTNWSLQRKIKEHTTPLYKLRRRVLLDQARNEIAAAWAPRGQWSEISNMKSDDIKDLIAEKRVFRRRLDDQAITMICEVHTPVRLEGNKVAHEAEQNLLRDAVVFGEPGPDVQVLKNIFQCVFDCDLN